MLKSNEVIGFQFFTKEECEDVIKYIEDKKSFLLQQKYNIEDTNVYDVRSQITTACYDRYNFFIDNPQYVDRFVYHISNVLPHLTFPIAVQSWVNIYKTGQGIKPHSHSGFSNYSFTSNIFLGGPTNPGITYFEPDGKKTVENKVGEIHILNSGLWHTVPPNKSKENRYTIGITFHSYEAITKDLLLSASFNSKNKNILLLTK